MNSLLRSMASKALKASVESFLGQLESSEPRDVLKKYDLLVGVASQYVTVEAPPELRNYVRAGCWGKCKGAIEELAAEDMMWGPMLKAAAHLEKVGSPPQKYAHVGDAGISCACGSEDLNKACDGDDVWICGSCGKEVVG